MTPQEWVLEKGSVSQKTHQATCDGLKKTGKMPSCKSDNARPDLACKKKNVAGSGIKKWYLVNGHRTNPN